MEIISYNTNKSLTNTLKIIENIYENDKLVINLQEPNNGLIATLNPLNFNITLSKYVTTLTKVHNQVKVIIKNEHVVMCNIKINGQLYCTTNVYIHPDMKNEELKSLIKEISLRLNSMQHLPTIITGDLNCENEMWSYKTNKTKLRANYIVDLCNEYGLRSAFTPDPNNWTYTWGTRSQSWIDAILFN